MISGHRLVLPMYNPGPEQAPEAQPLIDAFRSCDGIVVASPAYHGSVSGLVKNALDYTEELRTGSRIYLDGLPFGCIACGAGWQAAGQTLTTLRGIAHALRAWPTPLGGMLNTSAKLFDAEGGCVDAGAKTQLEMIGAQVTEFAKALMRKESGRPVGQTLERARVQ